MDSVEALAGAVDDLRRRLEGAGRDPAEVDVCFATAAGGDPGRDGFRAAEHLAALDELARIGVTWVQVRLPGDSVGHATEALERYGEEVVARVG
jgi:hypothetical protein